MAVGPAVATPASVVPVEAGVRSVGSVDMVQGVTASQAESQDRTNDFFFETASRAQLRVKTVSATLKDWLDAHA